MNRLKKIWEKMKGSSFFVSVIKVGSGQLAAQFFSLVSIPILSRIYSDTAYGETALITSTAAILTSASTLGLTSAVMKPEEDEEARTVFTTAFLVNFMICSGFVGIYLLLAGKRRLFEISGSYALALLLMWLYCVLNTTASLLKVYINRRKKYNKLFWNPIIGAVGNLVVAMPLGMLGLGFEGFMLTHIVQLLIVIIHMMRGDIPFSKKYCIRDFKRVIIDYKEYILFQYPSNFVGNFGIEYPTQYFGRTFTSQELGGYSMCVRILKFPVRLIAAPISTVYFRTATEYHREGKNLAGFTYQMISKILLISVLPITVFIFISEPLFAFVLGEAWREAGSLASFLIIQYVLLFCSQTTSYCRVSIGRQRMNLAVTTIRLIVAVVSCTAGYELFHTMPATLFCYSLGQCIYNIYDMATNFYCVDKRYLRKYLSVSIPYTIAMFAVYFLKRVFV